MFTCPVACSQDGCMRTFRYSYALLRHIQNTHDVAGVDNADNDIPIVDDDDDGDYPVLHMNPALHDDNPVAPDEQPHEQELGEQELGEQELGEQDVKKSAAIFVAKMKASSSMVQSTVDHVVTEASNLFSDIVGSLKRKTEVFLQSKNMGEDDIERENLLQVFLSIPEPLCPIRNITPAATILYSKWLFY